MMRVSARKKFANGESALELASAERLMDHRTGATSAIIVVDEQELDKLAGRKLLPPQPGWLPIFPVAPGGSSA